MSRGALVPALVLIVATASTAIDWGTFAARSDRSDDPLLLQALDPGDLATDILICEGVARRNDPYAGSIIDAIANVRTGVSAECRQERRADRSELLLRVLLAALLDPSLGAAAVGARIEANAAALESLVTRIDEWRDPQLAGALVRILPAMHGAFRLKALMRVGNRVVAGLERGKGVIPVQESILVM